LAIEKSQKKALKNNVLPTIACRLPKNTKEKKNKRQGL